MVELAIVVAIIAILGAIAAPRFGSIVERSKAKRLILDISRLQTAVDLYTEEHLGTNPAYAPGGSVGSAEDFVSRLTGHSDDDGAIDDAGLYGPYLLKLPTNAVSGKSGVRVDGAAAGANTHAWRFDSATGAIEPDHDGEIVADDGSINLRRINASVNAAVVGGGLDAPGKGGGKGLGG